MANPLHFAAPDTDVSLFQMGSHLSLIHELEGPDPQGMSWFLEFRAWKRASPIRGLHLFEMTVRVSLEEVEWAHRVVMHALNTGAKPAVAAAQGLASWDALYATKDSKGKYVAAPVCQMLSSRRYALPFGLTTALSGGTRQESAHMGEWHCGLRPLLHACYIFASDTVMDMFPCSRARRTVLWTSALYHGRRGQRPSCSLPLPPTGYPCEKPSSPCASAGTGSQATPASPPVTSTVVTPVPKVSYGSCQTDQDLGRTSSMSTSQEASAAPTNEATLFCGGSATRSTDCTPNWRASLGTAEYNWLVAIGLMPSTTEDCLQFIHFRGIWDFVPPGSPTWKTKQMMIRALTMMPDSPWRNGSWERADLSPTITSAMTVLEDLLDISEGDPFEEVPVGLYADAVFDYWLSDPANAPFTEQAWMAVSTSVLHSAFRRGHTERTYARRRASLAASGADGPVHPSASESTPGATSSGEPIPVGSYSDVSSEENDSDYMSPESVDDAEPTVPGTPRSSSSGSEFSVDLPSILPVACGVPVAMEPIALGDAPTAPTEPAVKKPAASTVEWVPTLRQMEPLIADVPTAPTEGRGSYDINPQLPAQPQPASAPGWKSTEKEGIHFIPSEGDNPAPRGFFAMPPVGSVRVIHAKTFIKVLDAIERRINEKKKRFKLKPFEQLCITKMVQAIIKEVLRPEDIIACLCEFLPVSLLKSAKWGDSRFLHTWNKLLMEGSDLWQAFLKAAIKAEPMDPDKAPRMLIADGDEGQLAALVIIAILERLIYKHFEPQNVKHLPYMEQLNKVMQILGSRFAGKSKELAWATVIETDGSAWDTCMGYDVNRLVCGPIFDHVLSVVLEHFKELLPRGAYMAMKELFEAKEFKVRLPDGMKKSIIAIMRSGSRGTAFFNWLVNFIFSYVAALGDHARQVVKDPEKTTFIDRFGETVEYSGVYEGDDGAGRRSPPYTAKQLLTILSWWDHVAFYMKYMCCTGTKDGVVRATYGVEEGELTVKPLAGAAVMTFCGSVYSVGVSGLTGKACRDLPRTLNSGAICCPVSIGDIYARPSMALPIIASKAYSYACLFADSGLYGVAGKYLCYGDSIGLKERKLVGDDVRGHARADTDFEERMEAVRTTPVDYVKEVNLVNALGWTTSIEEYARFCEYAWKMSDVFESGPVPAGFMQEN